MKMTSQRNRPYNPPSEPPRQERTLNPLHALQGAKLDHDRWVVLLGTAVIHARQSGCTWAEIGKALGVSASGARQRWHSFVVAAPGQPPRSLDVDDPSLAVDAARYVAQWFNEAGTSGVALARKLSGLPAPSVPTDQPPSALDVPAKTPAKKRTGRAR